MTSDDYYSEPDSLFDIALRSKAFDRTYLKSPKVTPEQAENLKFLCLECGSLMLRKTGKHGPFLGCSQFPKCKASISIVNPIGTEPVSERGWDEALFILGLHDNEGHPNSVAKGKKEDTQSGPCLSLALGHKGSNEDNDMTGYCADPDVGDF
jgi:ssDNA-binding Zn-finger/Zn-ribbon topoisomerase 1